MKPTLQFSRNRARPSISGAIEFQTKVKVLKNRKFLTKTINEQSLLTLCEILDQDEKYFASLEEFLSSRKYFTGLRKHRINELKKAASFSTKKLRGVILGFPFKCPVPFKTNYHTKPDLGEVMFLYRLGNIARILQNLTGKRVSITILEETQALSKVFQVSEKEGKEFTRKLVKYIKVLKIENSIKLDSLQQAVCKDLSIYNKKLILKAKEIQANKTQYTQLLNQILPTIALSLHTNTFSLSKSYEYINRFFQGSTLIKENNKLLKTAFLYISYTLLQKENKLREKQFLSYFQLSLCPKKERIGVRPTLESVKILPHHGVPVVTLKGDKKLFSIQYYLEFLNSIDKGNVTEFVSKEGNFLYYEVDETKQASV